MIKITELFIYHFDVQLDLTNFYNLDASYIGLVLNHQALVSFSSSSRTSDHPYAIGLLGSSTFLWKGKKEIKCKHEFNPMWLSSFLSY